MELPRFGRRRISGQPCTPKTAHVLPGRKFIRGAVNIAMGNAVTCPYPLTEDPSRPHLSPHVHSPLLLMVLT